MVARWVLLVVIGILLPGAALVRVVRPRPASLAVDVAWAAPTGCIVMLGGWALSRLVNWSIPAWLVGVSIPLLLLLVPRWRARLCARPTPGWGVPTAFAVAGAQLVLVAWMISDYLRLFPPHPAPSGSSYHPDVLFQLAVIGRLQHSGQLTYPLVAGEPFSYQWFGHAVLAELVGADPDRVDMVVRLAPATLMPAVVLLAAVVARQLARRDAAAGIAAALVGILGSTAASLSPDGFSVPVFQTYWWASLTTSFGWLATLAAAGTALAVLSGSTTGTEAPVRMLMPFAVFAAGAKPSDAAVLAGGACMAWLACVVLRRPAGRALAVAALFVVVLFAARVTMYGGGDYGLRVDLLGGFIKRASQIFPGLTDAASESGPLSLPQVSTVALLTGLFLYFLPLVPRLAGLVLLDHRDPRTWFFLGTMIAALGALAVMRHPAESESFFLISAYPVALVGSAYGLTRAWDRAGTRTAVAVAGLMAGAALCGAIALWFPADPRVVLAEIYGHAPAAQEMSPLRQAAHSAAPLALLITALAILSVGALYWARRARDRRYIAGTIIVAAVLGTGIPSTLFYISGHATTLATTTAEDRHNAVTRDEFDAAAWLSAHSGPDDIYATNRVCLASQVGQDPSATCVTKNFAFSAVSARRAYVGSWAYASRNLGTAWETTAPAWSAQPYWEPAVLQLEQAAFAAPSRANLDALRAGGARWLVADLRGTPIDIAGLDQLALRRFSSPNVIIWESR